MQKKRSLKNIIYQLLKILNIGYIGPLAGIHAGMDWLKKNSPETEWLITLPGDTPFIPSDLIFRFKNKISTKLKIILAISEQKKHPIIGAWHISLFSSLNISINKGTRKILKWAETHPIDYIKFAQKDYDPFFNINTKEDIKKAELIEKKILKKIQKR